MEKKTSKNIFLIIQSIFVLALLIVSLFSIKEDTLISIFSLVILAFVALYGIILYRKPHGNILKYAMILFSANIILSNCMYLYNSSELPTSLIILVVLQLLSAIVVAYCAGRLNRIDQNKYLFSLVLGILLILSIICSINVIIAKQPFVMILKGFYHAILFLTLAIAYFVRYKEHKEAGLIDAPKTK